MLAAYSKHILDISLCFGACISAGNQIYEGQFHNTWGLKHSQQACALYPPGVSPPPPQNMLTMRFANSFLYPLWNADHISNV